MPYRNEHSCRLVDPDEVDVVGSEMREHEGKKYRVIFGKPKGGDGSVEQAYRYPLSEGWTEAEARAHCRAHKGILFEPAEPEASSRGCQGRERVFLAAVHSIETGEEAHLATFYVMNTTPNRNGWGVSDKSLDEALPTLLRKPLGCGPEYRIDGHHPDPLKVGAFIRSDKPDGYALGTAEITDENVWGLLLAGEWGPISVVILSYRETCSKCLKDLTREDDPFSHECIAVGEAYDLVESFVFVRVDFIDVPAYPQAGLINLAGADAEVALTRCARFYESQSKSDQAQGPGAHEGSNPDEKRRKTLAELEQLKGKVTTLETKNTELEAELRKIREAAHGELVEEVLEARCKAGLVEDITQERTALTNRADDDLRAMIKDANKVTAKLASQSGAPKAKNAGGSDDTVLKAAMDETRLRLFGRKT